MDIDKDSEGESDGLNTSDLEVESVGNKPEGNSEGDESDIFAGEDPGEDDCSEEAQNSGSDLAYQIDPDSGRLLDDWYEVSEINPLDTIDDEVNDVDMGNGMVDSDEDAWDSD